MGRSAILGEQRNNYFCDVACGKAACGDSTYAITRSGFLCEFNNRRLLDKWVELRVSFLEFLNSVLIVLLIIIFYINNLYIFVNIYTRKQLRKQGDRDCGWWVRGKGDYREVGTQAGEKGEKIRVTKSKWITEREKERDENRKKQKTREMWN